MKPQQSLGEFMQISSESMDGLVIGANLENEDMNFIPALSLEHAAREAALADGLIENGAKGVLKPKKIGLRRGKWTQEEETYANKLIHEFKLGTLPLTDGTTLRTFLSKLLNCDPMRISKKFVGAKCIGKQVFRRRSPDLDKLTPEQIESNKNDLAELERNFLDRVSQTNKVKGGDEEEPEAEPVWSDGDGHRATRGRSAGLNGASSAGAHALYGMYGDQMPRTESATEMLDFQNIMNGSSGGLSQLANFATSPFPSYYGADGVSPYRGYGRGGFPHASSLEVLCAMPGAESLDNFGGLYKNDSFSWAKGGEMGSAVPVDIMTLNSNYYSATGANGAGGAGGGHPAGAEGGYFASGASLPYSSSAEWPSMNNLVVAAETIEHLGSMNSLLGGGLMESIANFRALQSNNPQGETFPMAATHPLESGRNSADHNSIAGNGEQLSVKDAAASSFSSLQDRASNHSRGTNSDHSIKEGGAGEAAPGEAQGQDNNVGLSIDEEEDLPSTASSAHQSSTSLSINKEVLAEVDSEAGGMQDATPITNMLRANDLYQARVAAVEAANAAHRQSSVKTGSGHVPPQMSDLVPKNSSISDFWMLVGLGDLPRPDQDVLSSSLWPSGSERTSTSNASERSAPASEPAAVTPPSPIKQVGSPRITPDQLPPHLQKALLESSLAKHSRQSSTDSLTASRGSTGTDEQPLAKRLRATEAVAAAVGGGNR